MSSQRDIYFKLSRQQRRAIDALANGATNAQAAASAGRHRRTLHRWLTEDLDFQEALKRSTDAAVTTGAQRLAHLLDDAVTALHDVMTSESAHDRDILRAANMVITNLVRLRELTDLAERVDELEARLYEQAQR